MIFLDTNVCIALMRGNIVESDLSRVLDDTQYAVTTPTLFELYEGYYLFKYTKKAKTHTFLKEMKKGIEDLIRKTTCFDLDVKAAEIASRINNSLIGKGKSIEVFDCLIAGVVLSHGYSKIFTNNLSHFENIEGLKPYEIRVF